MKLVHARSEGVTEELSARRFRMVVGRSLWFEVELASYVHIPLVAYVELRRDEDLWEVSSVAAPRLAVIGGRPRELFAETIARDDFERPGTSRLAMLGDHGNETPVDPGELVATVGDNYDVRMKFEIAPSGLPRFRIREPEIRMPDGGIEGEALVPICRLVSPFTASIDFHVYTVTRPGAKHAT